VVKELEGAERYKTNLCQSLWCNKQKGEAITETSLSTINCEQQLSSHSKFQLSDEPYSFSKEVTDNSEQKVCGR
jgi:hypothetical protein